MSLWHVTEWVCVCVSAPVGTSPPPPAGEVVKYSSQTADHIVPSQDIQGDSSEQSLFKEQFLK